VTETVKGMVTGSVKGMVTGSVTGWEMGLGWETVMEKEMQRG
jgi:hypothetical protein